MLTIHQCDGHQPCQNCVRRGSECIFDTVSGSAHSVHLKSRVRALESQNRDLEIHNRILQARVSRLEVALASSQYANTARGTTGGEKPWIRVQGLVDLELDFEPPSRAFLSNAQADTNGARSQEYPMHTMGLCCTQDSSHDVTWGQGDLLPMANDTENALLSTHSPSLTTSPHDVVNKSFAHFINDRRKALQDGSDPELVLNSGLDVGPLFDTTRVPTAWSDWALRLPFASKSLTLCQKLACAFVTYHQMRWLIYPTEANYGTIPLFIKPTVAQLCIPHKVWIHIFVRSANEVGEAMVLDMVDGQEAQSRPTLLSTSIKEWSKPLSEAVYSDTMTGHVRLTSAFERFVLDSENWNILRPSD